MIVNLEIHSSNRRGSVMGHFLCDALCKNRIKWARGQENDSTSVCVFACHSATRLTAFLCNVYYSKLNINTFFNQRCL